ncbi:sigma factor-like helix-turn-helix DNA-binding protein [Lacinutrix jangbogonensis]|uniref:sigma factor-like helix-turn-helix DNA-binding protein n=1 Tax=Lacinutrix jangbogonensis TaxID=1469557 RepID=UPI00068C2E55|nr:sigma factor-like helix-turn-helix DNA-binding protein [Lacinutrix jangbogonensis]
MKQAQLGKKILELRLGKGLTQSKLAEKYNLSLKTIQRIESKEAALAFMNDPEYLPHLKARTKGSVSNYYLIKGKDELK